MQNVVDGDLIFWSYIFNKGSWSGLLFIDGVQMSKIDFQVIMMYIFYGFLD